MTAREDLTAVLAPLLPADWKLIPYQDSTDTLSSTTVMLKLSSIQKHPSAPLGAYLTDWTVTVVDPTRDFGKAEDRLDDAVLQLLAALDGINSTLWSTAEKVLFQDSYLAYDISVQVATRKDG